MSSVDEARKVIDESGKAWNSRDTEARLKTLHFPHGRINPQGRAELVDAPQIKRNWDQFLEYCIEHEGWDHSSWNAEVIHESDVKVHFEVEWSRHRTDGVKYATLRSLWIVTKVDGRWGVALVSNLGFQYHLPPEEVKRLNEKQREMWKRISSND